MRRPVAVAVVAIALVACSGNGNESSTGPTGTHVTSTGGGATSTTAFVGQVTPASVAVTHPTRFLTAVRVGGHDGFDRVVFEFEAGTPGYAVRYVPRPITEDASGKDVTVPGDAVLGVRMEAAGGADLTGSSPRQTYTGPTRIASSGGAVTEVVRTADFEGVLNWAIGVRARTPFHAYTSEGNKLIIDIGVA